MQNKDNLVWKIKKGGIEEKWRIKEGTGKRNS